MKPTIGIFRVLLGLRGAHELVLENIDDVEDDATGSEDGSKNALMMMMTMMKCIMNR